MGNYDIQSRDFALSQQGIHLLRNRFNYKTIGFRDVKKATFARSVDTKNVVVTLIAGILLVAFAAYQAIGVYREFHDPTVFNIYIESIILPVLPLLVGLYCIYLVIKKVPLLIVEVDSETHKLSLHEVIKTGQLEVLENYLKIRLKERFYDDLTNR